jgi:hypothetical protein
VSIFTGFSALVSVMAIFVASLYSLKSHWLVKGPNERMVWFFFLRCHDKCCTSMSCSFLKELSLHEYQEIKVNSNRLIYKGRSPPGLYLGDGTLIQYKPLRKFRNHVVGKNDGKQLLWSLQNIVLHVQVLRRFCSLDDWILTWLTRLQIASCVKGSLCFQMSCRARMLMRCNFWC